MQTVPYIINPVAKGVYGGILNLTDLTKSP